MEKLEKKAYYRSKQANKKRLAKDVSVLSITTYVLRRRKNYFHSWHFRLCRSPPPSPPHHCMQKVRRKKEKLSFFDMRDLISKRPFFFFFFCVFPKVSFHVLRYVQRPRPSPCVLYVKAFLAFLCDPPPPPIPPESGNQHRQIPIYSNRKVSPPYPMTHDVPVSSRDRQKKRIIINCDIAYGKKKFSRALSFPSNN